MDILTAMTPVHAAALYVGLMVLLMLGLKLYVGNRRAKYKVASGDNSNPDFSRAQRVQMNTVEDAPVLIAGLLALALVGIPALYIHILGAALFVSRLLHALGLAGLGGFGFGRMAGTLGTLLVFLAMGAMLIVHAFYPLPG